MGGKGIKIKGSKSSLQKKIIYLAGARQHMCHDTYIKVKGHPMGISSLIP